MQLKYKLTFSLLKTPSNEVIMQINFVYENKEIPLSLAQLMQFLYEYENKLEKNLNDFLFLLAKIVRKFQHDNKLIYGIKSDDDMVLFIDYIQTYKISLHYLINDTQQPCNFSNPLPIHIDVSRQSRHIYCQFAFLSTNIFDQSPLFIFRSESKQYIFMDGIFKLLPTHIADFICDGFELNKVIFSETKDIIFFNKHLYTPLKSALNWTLRTSIKDLLPKEITPFPVLNLNYNDQVLSPTLLYKYENETISPDYKEEEIINKKNGTKMKRMLDMEQIYQQDLMALFNQYELPFMLTNPGDISLFLTKVVSHLKKRDWIIHSNVPDFTVHETPITLNFNIEDAEKDWFSFNPNCTILDQNVPLHEIARLMVENQGYVKTKKGFVKLSNHSQEELKLLTKMNAFKVGKTFDKKEMSVFAAISNVKANSESTQQLISKAKGFNQKETLNLNELNGTLRSYQEYGVQWMNFLSHMGSGGVLADDMGLGKTVQTLAFSSQFNQEGPILVICPTTVTYNWRNEIQKFLPKQEAIVYAGPNRHKYLESLDQKQFIIASYGIIKNDIEWLSSIQFKAIFVDEAQYMKNPQSQISKAIKALHAHFKLAMSGTPVENRLLDIWNLFDFTMPGYLGTKKQFELALDTDQQDVIKAKIKPFILRREKREVLDSLPDKTEIILKCPLSEQQMQLYKTVLDATKKGIQKSKQTKNKLHMLTALLKLRQVCTHPELIEECKGSNIESAKFNLLKEKCEELISENHKVVIFSQFTQMLDIIQKWANEQKIAIERIDGSITGKQRINAVERFQTSSIPTLFLVSLKAGGVGINLTAADYVIHVDPWWNPAIESQATDRVHRMGQKNKVIVYKLICEETIEEKIQQLQAEKKQLLTEIVDLEDQESQKINIDAITSLISNSL